MYIKQGWRNTYAHQQNVLSIALIVCSVAFFYCSICVYTNNQTNVQQGLHSTTNYPHQIVPSHSTLSKYLLVKA